MLSRLRSDERGFTIVEVMAATLILTIGVLGTVSLVDDSNSATERSMGREAATNVERDLVENVRLIPYPKATSAGIVAEMQARPGLADASADSGWQIQRRNRTYTVNTAICTLDDPKDGLGEHDSSFCADSATAGTADGNAKDYKRVTFTLSWRSQTGGSLQARQSSILAPRGTADLPRVTNLAMILPFGATPPTVPVITDQNTTMARFKVTTSTIPTGVNWLENGGVKGLASGGGLIWNFDWSLPAGKPDGTYQVGAQPFDSSGASGEATTMPVKLNRYLPAAPSPVYAGFNVIPGTNGSRRVDVEWFPNTEKDVAGYRVYYQYTDNLGAPSGAVTPICPTTATDSTSLTTCSFTLPKPAGGVGVNVLVSAIEADTLREGPKTTKPAFLAQNAPNPPGDATPATEKPGDGTIALNWTPSTDPDTGDKVLFYRIYRAAGTPTPPPQCQGNDPYDRTPFETGTEGATRRWVDPKPLTGPATYAVCAVDTHMALSTPPKYFTVTYP